MKMLELCIVWDTFEKETTNKMVRSVEQNIHDSVELNVSVNVYEIISRPIWESMSGEIHTTLSKYQKELV